MSNIFERLMKISDFKGYNSVNDFAKNGLGYASSEKLNRLKDPTKRPSFDIIEDVSNKFVDINVRWIVTGKGEMIDQLSKIEDRTKHIDDFKEKYLEVLEKNMELHEENKRLRELATKKDTEFPKETYYRVAEDTPKPLAGSKKKLK